MRTFISLEIPKEVKTEIGLIQKRLKFHLPKARWAKPEISHLTLAFLGSITPNKIRLVKKILNQSAVDRPIKLKFYQIGGLPNPKKARVIFLDLKGDLDKLDRLAKNIRHQLKKEGIYFDEKPFLAHLTLGRLKRHQDISPFITKIQIPQKEFLAPEVRLVKSTLTSSGPIYEGIYDKISSNGQKI